MSLGRARLDGDSLYGEPLFSLLGEVAAGLRGRDMVDFGAGIGPYSRALCENPANR